MGTPHLPTLMPRSRAGAPTRSLRARRPAEGAVRHAPPSDRGGAAVSQAGFDGGFVPRVRPRGRRAFGDAKSEEVPRGAAGACDAAGVRVRTADRACWA